jgi:uncharacterized protein HemX
MVGSSILALMEEDALTHSVHIVDAIEDAKRSLHNPPKTSRWNRIRTWAFAIVLTVSLVLSSISFVHTNEVLTNSQRSLAQIVQLVTAAKKLASEAQTLGAQNQGLLKAHSTEIKDLTLAYDGIVTELDTLCAHTEGCKVILPLPSSPSTTLASS